MSRALSTAAITAGYAQETGEAYAILLSIFHDSLSQPIRVTTCGVNLTSRGNLFVALPFEITLPIEQEGTVPTARISIDNIDRQIVTAIRTLQPGDKAKTLIEIILESDPENVEVSFDELYLSNVTYDAFTVQGDLTVEGFASRAYPSGVFSPKYFPGLF